MGGVALLTALALRRRGESSRTPLVFGSAALLVGVVLMASRI
jgi:hypothetical protein